MSENFVEIAKKNEISGKYAKALEYYFKEIESNTVNITAYDGAAMCLYKLGKLDDAYDMSVKSSNHADRAEPHLLRSFIYSHKNKFKEAFEEAKTAFEKKPNSVDVQQCYGSALLNIGQIDEGISVLEKALLIEPKSIFINMNLAFGYNQKIDFEKQKIYTRAVFNLNPSIKTGLYFLSTFENKYGFVLATAIYVFILIAYLIRDSVFLVIPIFYIFYKLPFVIFAIKRRDLPHAKAIGILLLLITFPIICFFSVLRLTNLA